MFQRPGALVGAFALVIAVAVGACGSSSATTGPSTASAPSAASAASAPSAASATPSVAQPVAPSPAQSRGPSIPATADCQESAATGAYAMAACEFHSPALANNLIGDAPIFEASILTPADYATSGKRYPVVYMLGGYSDNGTGFAFGLGGLPAPSDSSALLPIWVVVNGMNSFGGGFYVNSSVTGNWEDAIVQDLVDYMDAKYRTVAKPEGRGIAGHSMGGFGAVNIAMRHPDVFSVMYSMSPGLFDPTGVDARCGDSAAIVGVLDVQKKVAGKTGTDLAKAMASNSSGDNQFELAYGMAFVPDPASPILTQFPFKTEDGKTVRDDAIWAKWEAGFGGLPAKVAQYKSNLAALKGIVIDYGRGDEYTWIPRGSHYFVGLLKDAGIAAEERIFEGTHADSAVARLATQVLPYMQQKLATS